MEAFTTPPSGFTGDSRFGLGRWEGWRMGYRVSEATKRQRLPPSKLRLVLEGPTTPQGIKVCSMQAESPRAMGHGLGT